MTYPTIDYAEQRTAEVVAACQSRNGARAVALLRQIQADGFPDLAERLTQVLLQHGLTAALRGSR